MINNVRLKRNVTAAEVIGELEIQANEDVVFDRKMESASPQVLGERIQNQSIFLESPIFLKN